ncbi:hypothetical protein [Vibrio tasmaniensis]|uniref:hypothetical protein n=1 Tax=Vibrio tasmaniensis TaxID=212663 RepID=UPI001436B9C5|nr:hypothetical protein [Vibrio tasmaniensis]
MSNLIEDMDRLFKTLPIEYKNALLSGSVCDLIAGKDSLENVASNYSELLEQLNN